MSMAQVNIAGNIQHAQQIRMEELAAANEQSSSKFYDIQNIVRELSRITGLK